MYPHLACNARHIISGHLWVPNICSVATSRVFSDRQISCRICSSKFRHCVALRGVPRSCLHTACRQNRSMSSSSRLRLGRRPSQILQTLTRPSAHCPPSCPFRRRCRVRWRRELGCWAGAQRGPGSTPLSRDGPWPTAFGISSSHRDGHPACWKELKQHIGRQPLCSGAKHYHPIKSTAKTPISERMAVWQSPWG